MFYLSKKINSISLWVQLPLQVKYYFYRATLATTTYVKTETVDAKKRNTTKKT